jgi:cytidyltransferase-like protein
MILNYNELANHVNEVIMVDGCFDPLHVGHIKYIEEAAKFKIPVFCNIQSDNYIIETKKRSNLLPEEQRCRVIDSLKGVSYVHVCKTSTHDILRKIKPKKYVKGIDWKYRGLPQIEQDICKELDIEIVYLDTMLDSSTNICNIFLKTTNESIQLNQTKRFEKYAFSQRTIDSKEYDDEYFQGGWRTGNNDYSIEIRRQREGNNPKNIQDTFHPRCVLDVGCGPGALMLFLHELGIDTYGIDFSRSAKELAPQEIQSHIIVHPVTEYYNFEKSFDLVICRELLEHLTVFQVKQTVHTLARYTSKFLYVTTRFSQPSEGFLGICADKETDPTHITLLNKEFLRALFILEGLKSRRDLEDRLDWKKYGRVLVFERGP